MAGSNKVWIGSLVAALTSLGAGCTGEIAGPDVGDALEGSSDGVTFTVGEDVRVDRNGTDTTCAFVIDRDRDGDPDRDPDGCDAPDTTGDETTEGGDPNATETPTDIVLELVAPADGDTFLAYERIGVEVRVRAPAYSYVTVTAQNTRDLRTYSAYIGSLRDRFDGTLSGQLWGIPATGDYELFASIRTFTGRTHSQPVHIQVTCNPDDSFTGCGDAPDSEPEPESNTSEPEPDSPEPEPDSPEPEPEPDPEATDNGCADPVEQAVIDLVNRDRAAQGLQTVACNAAMANAAQAHSQDMCDNGYFSHTSLDGRSPADRLREAGVSFSYWGENIAWGYSSADAVHTAWMNSSGHRANILNGAFGRIGVGAVNCGGRYYWTEVFTN